MATDDPTPALRITVLTVVVAMLLGALLSRLWFLQVLAGDRYVELAQSNEVRTVLTEAPRGRILDRNGEEIVKNRVAHTISADRNRLLNAAGNPRNDEASEVLDRLSRLLEIPIEDVIQRMTSVRWSPFRPTPIAIDVAPEIVFSVSEHAELFPGVVAERLPVRTYPYGSVAAHVLGHVGEISQDELDQDFFADLGYQPGTLVGKAGLERAYEEHLQGIQGAQRLRVNASGTVLGLLSHRPYVPGHDVVSTLDLELQGKVERILAQGVHASRFETHRASGRNLASTGASAVVLDPRNGEILAMASYPTFDPSEYVGGLSREYARYLFPQEGDPDTYGPAINRPIASAQPPGSVYKIVSGLAALEAGQITPTSTVDCPPVFSRWQKFNWNRAHEGRMTVSTALMRSCDTFFYELAYQQYQREERAIDAGEDPDEAYARIARALGYGARLGIEVPGERPGNVPDREWKRSYWQANEERLCSIAANATAGTYVHTLYSDLCVGGWVWRPGDAVNMSIGQGEVSATPLQVAASYMAVANGGTVWQPHLAREIRDAEGNLVMAIEPEVFSHIETSEANWRAIQRGVEDVVMGARGTAVAAFGGFPLDEIPVAGKTGTAEASGDRIPFSWFAGYAPADDPQYVVVVMVEEGGGGSQTAAPMVRRIFDVIYDLPVEPFRAGPGNLD